MTSYDVIVIGGGSGGYSAATRLSEHGKKTLLIEKAQFGGVCLNDGCISIRTLLDSAKLYAQIAKSDIHGIFFEQHPRFDLHFAQARKQKIIGQLHDGMIQRLDHAQVEVMAGKAHIIDCQTVQVDKRTYKTSHIVIATGASFVVPDVPGIDSPHVMTAAELLSVNWLPSDLVILGGGAFAIGIATIFSLLGVSVTMITSQPEMLPEVDHDIVDRLKLELATTGVNLEYGTAIHRIEPDAVVMVKGGKKIRRPADTVVICGERSANVGALGKLAINYDASGSIYVNDQMQTTLSNVYAVGDVTGRSMWAFSAARMGEVAANAILGIPDQMRYNAVPTLVYSCPEVASVGLTEAQAQAQGFDVKTARLALESNGRFLAEFEGSRGLGKVVINAQTNTLLGVHLIAPRATELIFEAATLLAREYCVDDIKQLMFPHSILHEILKDVLKDA